MTKPKFKRALQEVTCDVCGCKFKQIRHWQAYCSTSCRVKAWHRNCANALNAAERVAQLERELARLKGILEDASIPY